ncbi:hypothetical protein FRC08_014003 [Ceratobasidium sp. 394]|nr:hypothetical protein FRC08_014003 [Ceratobasidium sp. 394]
MSETPHVVRVGTPQATLGPQVITVTSPRAESQSPSVIRVGTPKVEEPVRIICVAAPRTSVPPYIPLETPAPAQPALPEHLGTYVGQVSDPSSDPDWSTPRWITTFDAPIQQIRVTSPTPVKYPPPPVIHVGTTESECDYTPQIVHVSSTKPVVIEAPLTMVCIPTARGKHKLQPHVIHVASPPAVVGTRVGARRACSQGLGALITP